jgi:hypothetical protein
MRTTGFSRFLSLTVTDPRELQALFVVQLFADDAWRSVYVSSFREEAEEAFDEVDSELTAMDWDTSARLVEFAVKGVDFIATHSDDFRRLAQR